MSVLEAAASVDPVVAAEKATAWSLRLVSMVHEAAGPVGPVEAVVAAVA